MNSRWFIPVSFGSFALVVGVLWTYLSRNTDELASPTPRQVFAAPKEDLFPAHNRPLGKARGPRPSWLQTASQVGDRIDEEFSKIRSDFSHAVPVMFARAQSDLREGHYESALHGFENLLVQSPDNPIGLAGRAQSLIGLGKFTDAAQAYSVALTHDPRNVRTLYNYGVTLYRLARFGEAAEQFRRVIEIDPQHAQAQYNVATLAQREGRLLESAAAWHAFTKLRPSVASGWFNLGVTKMDLDRPLEAAWSFSQYISAEPADAQGHLNLGLAYAAAGNLEEADEAMQRAQEIAPCDPQVNDLVSQLHQLMFASADSQSN